MSEMQQAALAVAISVTLVALGFVGTFRYALDMDWRFRVAVGFCGAGGGMLVCTLAQMATM